MSRDGPSDLPADGTIRVRGVTLDFGARSRAGAARGVRALDHVDLDITPGEVLGLVGESGSGKTTLGKTILGAYRPTAGQIFYRGRDLAALAPGRWGALRRDLQMVFQDPLSSFNPRFTIASSLALPLRLHRIFPRERIAAETANLLRRVGLGAEHAARYPHELSGGQLQRVAIARAISVAPRVIVADEAVSKLDVSVRAQILNLLKRMNRETGVSLVFITHDLGVARFICDRIAVMYFGRVIELGPTEQVFGAPRHPYTQTLLQARSAGPVATDADEISLAIADPARACNYAARCVCRIETCTTVRPALQAGEAHAAACLVPVTAAGAPPEGDVPAAHHQPTRMAGPQE